MLRIITASLATNMSPMNHTMEGWNVWYLGISVLIWVVGCLRGEPKKGSYEFIVQQCLIHPQCGKTSEGMHVGVPVER